MKSKILIAYFSHEGEGYVDGRIVPLEIGNTRIAAETMKKLTGGDIFRIEPVEPYPYQYLRTIDVAKEELETSVRPEIKGELPDIKGYKTVILGYPNWWGTMPMAVHTFLESYDFAGKTIIPFCTHEGSAMGRSEGDIKKLCPEAKVLSGLAIKGGSVNKSDEKIAAWCKVSGNNGR